MKDHVWHLPSAAKQVTRMRHNKIRNFIFNGTSVSSECLKCCMNNQCESTTERTAQTSVPIDGSKSQPPPVCLVRKKSMITAKLSCYNLSYMLRLIPISWFKVSLTKCSQAMSEMYMGNSEHNCKNWFCVSSLNYCWAGNYWFHCLSLLCLCRNVCCWVFNNLMRQIRDYYHLKHLCIRDLSYSLCLRKVFIPTTEVFASNIKYCLDTYDKCTDQGAEIIGDSSITIISVVGFFLF